MVSYASFYFFQWAQPASASILVYNSFHLYRISLKKNLYTYYTTLLFTLVHRILLCNCIKNKIKLIVYTVYSVFNKSGKS